ncbi:MAG: hypothetical protein ABI351_13125 [Herbaspirillum sp.]
MQENWNDSELHLLVTSTRRDGRRRYDPKSKHALAKARRQPGVSLARVAVTRRERQPVAQMGGHLSVHA